MEQEAAFKHFADTVDMEEAELHEPVANELHVPVVVPYEANSILEMKDPLGHVSAHV